MAKAKEKAAAAATREEYMEDAQGRQVPVSMIKELDLRRDATVKAVMARTLKERDRLLAFKRAACEQVMEFVEAGAKDSGAKRMGGEKGNVTITSYDGRWKVLAAVHDYIQFNEKLRAAKQLIDRCIREWSKGARPEIRALVDDAFYVGKAGKASASRIMGLRRLKIDDPTWKKAMDAIGDSVHAASSKTYMRFYERAADGEYRQIPLDVAAL